MLGFHATVFVYGQTGSGKTFTMEGYEYQTSDVTAIKPIVNRTTNESNDGIIPRAIRDLFQAVQLKRSANQKITVTCQYIQLYNEKIFDLLNTKSQKAVR